MGTIKEKLDYLQETKELFRGTLVNMGLPITKEMPFRQYIDILKLVEVNWNLKFEENYVPVEAKVNVKSKRANFQENLLPYTVDDLLTNFQEEVPYIKNVSSNFKSETKLLSDNCLVPYDCTGEYIDVNHLIIKFQNPVELIQGLIENWNVTGADNEMNTVYPLIINNIILNEDDNTQIEIETSDSLENYNSFIIEYNGVDDLIKSLDKTLIPSFSISIIK